MEDVLNIYDVFSKIIPGIVLLFAGLEIVSPLLPTKLNEAGWVDGVGL